ncbi:MAG: MFS transporter, partial [Actinobacteria bacterium]|nr:MFS transporter [Actinomycetota bacterium]
MGITGVVTAAAFETIAVATAMPDAVKAVNGLGAYAWAFNGVVIATMVATVAGGDFSDRKGPKLPLVGGLLVFALGLVVCATAHIMPVFVLGRVMQGLGGGSAIVAVYVVVARGYEAKLRAQVFSALAAAWVVPSLVGPFIAGAIAEFWTWRVVFFGVIPIVLIAIWLVWPLVNSVDGPGGNVGFAEDEELVDQRADSVTDVRRSGRTRWAASLAAGAVLVQDGGRRLGVIGGIEAVIGLVIVGFALQRLLPNGSLRLARGLPSAIGARGLLAGAFFGAQAFVPLMLVDQRGLGLTLAGLSLTTSSLGWFVGSWWQGRPDLTIHRDRLIIVGA